MGPNEPDAVIYFDGQCSLCDRWVRFVIARDRRKRFHFASLQSAVAAQTLGQEFTAAPETIVVRFEGEQSQRSGAVLVVLRELGAPWSLVYHVGRWCPERARNAVYDLVAHHRHRWFGRTDTCPPPPADIRDRFLHP